MFVVVVVCGCCCCCCCCFGHRRDRFLRLRAVQRSRTFSAHCQCACSARAFVNAPEIIGQRSTESTAGRPAFAAAWSVMSATPPSPAHVASATAAGGGGGGGGGPEDSHRWLSIACAASRSGAAQRPPRNAHQSQLAAKPVRTVPRAAVGMSPPLAKALTRMPPSPARRHEAAPVTPPPASHRPAADAAPEETAAADAANGPHRCSRGRRGENGGGGAAHSWRTSRLQIRAGAAPKISGSLEIGAVAPQGAPTSADRWRSGQSRHRGRQSQRIAGGRGSRATGGAVAGRLGGAQTFQRVVVAGRERPATARGSAHSCWTAGMMASVWRFAAAAWNGGGLPGPAKAVARMRRPACALVRVERDKRVLVQTARLQTGHHPADRLQAAVMHAAHNFRPATTRPTACTQLPGTDSAEGTRTAAALHGSKSAVEAAAAAVASTQCDRSTVPSIAAGRHTWSM